SKYGATADIAHRLAGRLGPDTQVFDLADGQPDLTGFDTVVLGTAIYAHQPLPAMKEFTGATPLDGKRIALFMGGMETDPAKRAAEVEAAFPPELAARARNVAFLGGKFQFAKMNAPERFVIKRIAKTKTDQDQVDDAAIAAFAATLTDGTGSPSGGEPAAAE
ncbi:MAG: flavodoxin domain-containing protein, partial [Bifidobacteriaceae bacterium]|nr:flavodoxin domain-containing protein [Bifidobacteriaceae bacterium]